MSSVCFILGGVYGCLSFINIAGQNDKLNFGLGGADQVNRAQSMVQCIKDTVSLLVQRSDTLPYWDRERCIVMFVTQKKLDNVALWE